MVETRWLSTINHFKLDNAHEEMFGLFLMKPPKFFWLLLNITK
jgi:hypothetical protein